jgi:hypothetical protein
MSQIIYESMKVKVERVLERGKVEDENITSGQEREAFNKWADSFTRQDHPAVIQVPFNRINYAHKSWFD